MNAWIVSGAAVLGFVVGVLLGLSLELARLRRARRLLDKAERNQFATSELLLMARQSAAHGKLHASWADEGLGSLLETIQQWLRNGYIRSDESPLDEHGKRVLREVVDEITARVSDRAPLA